MFSTAARRAEWCRTQFPNIDRTLFRTALPIRAPHCAAAALPFRIARRLKTAQICPLQRSTFLHEPIRL